MSLSPIQIFQQQQNPLAQILAGGNNTITGIFDRAIQIGRDMSNKQLQQEQDMMSMRNQETNLMQRRAENLQQNNEDAIKFARGAFESDRKFGVDQTQQAFQNERVTANDLFGQQTDTARLDIAREGLDIRKEDQQMQRDAVEAGRAARAAEQTQIKGILGDSSAEASTAQKPFIKGSAINNYGTGPSASAVLNGDPNKRLGELDAALGSKTLTLPQEAQLRGEKNKIEEEQKKNGAGGGGSPFAAQNQTMKVTKFDQDQLDRKDEAMRSNVEDNTMAFPTQTSSIYSRQDKVAADKKASKSPEKIQDVPQRDIDQALEYDKNRYSSEKTSARRMTLPEYLAKGPQDEDSKKAREELWNYVNIGAEAPAAQSGADTWTAKQKADDEYARAMKRP
jgi:stress response protein YsnF